MYALMSYPIGNELCSNGSKLRFSVRGFGCALFCYPEKLKCLKNKRKKGGLKNARKDLEVTTPAGYDLKIHYNTFLREICKLSKGSCSENILGDEIMDENKELKKQRKLEEKEKRRSEKRRFKNKQKNESKKRFAGLIKGLSIQTKVISFVVFGAVIIGTILIVTNNNKEGNLTTISESSLQKIIEINELSTVDYTYNATAAKYSEDNQNIKYYVAYEGTVTAGIDFHEISFELDEEQKKISITLPPVEIHDIRIDMGTMEYIFTKNKYETETISQEAYKLCKKDLENRVSQEKILMETAKDNAVSSVEALFKPWIETIDDSYTVEIK